MQNEMITQLKAPMNPKFQPTEEAAHCVYHSSGRASSQSASINAFYLIRGVLFHFLHMRRILFTEGKNKEPTSAWGYSYLSPCSGHSASDTFYLFMYFC